MDGGSGRYAAFLSYSHKDAAAARWLHRRLETYRIPRRLVGKEGERGPVPARLTPIFRDREELPAAGDLSERVRAALAASDNLIILCSPNAAASPWVAKEIAAFRELHPDRPVFAAIVEGEPPLCFPPNLAAAAGAEPLAADLRPHADGRRLGFLKLVAGLSGVGLDALVQRDAQRRLRRVTAVTAAALAAMLVMAVLTGLALSQRREAQRQRAEAEGLVEFMLTDLRDRLRGVGRLDAMESANARALRYYDDGSEAGDLPDDSLARRARILHAVGEDDLDADRLDDALRAFASAHAATAVQLARHPDDFHLLLEQGRNEYGIGRVHELRKQWDSAGQRYRRFSEAAGRVASASPTPTNLAEAASASVDLGNVEFKQQHHETAQGHYQAAVRLLDAAAALAAHDPHIQLARANAYGWLASTFYAQRKWPDAVSTRQLQKRIVVEAGTRDPRNADIKFRLAAADRGLACALLRSGEAARSHAALLEALLLTDELGRIDDGNKQWRALGSALRQDLLGARAGPGIANGPGRHASDTACRPVS